MPLFEVADIQLGKMLDKAKNRGIPKRYLRNINVRWRYFDLSDLLEMPFTESELVKFSINDGDVLVCEGGEPGRAAVWRSGKTNLKYQKALHRVRVKDNVIPEWIVYQIEYLAKSGDLEKYFTGTTIKHLPREALSKASFVVPAIEDQQNILAKIDNAFFHIDRLAAEVQRALELLDRMDHSSLGKAFRGELVPQDPNDEPASVLLDRIRAARSQMTNVPRARRRAQQA